MSRGFRPEGIVFGLILIVLILLLNAAIFALRDFAERRFG